MARQHQQQEETIIIQQQAVLSESYRLRHDNGRQVRECCCEQGQQPRRRRKRIRQTTMVSVGVIKNVWTVILVVLLLCTDLNRIEYYEIHYDGDGADSSATNLFFWSSSSSKQRRQRQPLPFLVVSAEILDTKKSNKDDSDLSMQKHSMTIMGEGEEEKDVVGIKQKTHVNVIDDMTTTSTTESSIAGGNNKVTSTSTSDDDDDDDETRRLSSRENLKKSNLQNQETKKVVDDSSDVSQTSTPTPSSSSSSSTPLLSLDTDTDDTTTSSKTTTSSSEEEEDSPSSCSSASSAASSLSSSSNEETCQSNEGDGRTTVPKLYGSLSKENDQRIADLEENEDTISRTTTTTTTNDKNDVCSKTHGKKQDECNDSLATNNNNKVPTFLEEAKKLLKLSKQQQQQMTTSQESSSAFDYASHLEQCHLYSMILHHDSFVSDYYNWCQSYEMKRLLSNEDALRTTSYDDAPIIIKSLLPSDLLKRLREFYNDSSSIATTHVWSEGEAIVYTNPWNSVEPPQYIQLSDCLKDELFDSIETMWMEKVDSSLIVSFSNQEEIGIRTLSRGAVISPHTTATLASSDTTFYPNHAIGVAIVVLDVIDEKDHTSNSNSNNKVENNDNDSSPQPSWIWELHYNKNNNNTCHEGDHAGTSSTVPTLSSFPLQAGDILFIENVNHVVMGAPYPLLHDKVTYMELYFSTTKKHDTSKTTKTTRTKSYVKRDYLNARRQRQQSQNNKSLEETASSASSVTSGSSSSLVASQSYVDVVPPTSQFLSSTSTATIPHYLTSPLERKLWNTSRPTETKVSIQQVLKTSGTSFLSKKEMTIHRAAALGDVTQMQFLVEKYGSSILQKKDSNGWQPLHEAARSGEVEAIQFLLDHKVEVNVRTNRGKGGNALYWAAKANGVHHPSVKLLEDHGAILQKPLVRIV